MTATATIDDAIEYYLSVINFRSKELFSYFFVKGYKYTQLSSVMSEYENETFSAKMYLGMLITLIDDLADNPKCFNPGLLSLMYSNEMVTLEKLSVSDIDLINLKNFLFKNLHSHIKKLPNYEELVGVFNFDLEKVYLSNKFSELITSKTFICNNYEMKLYGSYTMGVLAAGMIDLMGIKNINYGEIGACREIFIIGQRLAKIANNISTFAREKLENDITNEITHSLNTSKKDFNYYKNKLEKEFLRGIKLIDKSKNKISSFNVLDYSHGIEKLFELNMSLIGKI